MKLTLLLSFLLLAIQASAQVKRPHNLTDAEWSKVLTERSASQKPIPITVHMPAYAGAYRIYRQGWYAIIEPDHPPVQVYQLNWNIDTMNGYRYGQKNYDSTRKWIIEITGIDPEKQKP